MVSRSVRQLGQVAVGCLALTTRLLTPNTSQLLDDRQNIALAHEQIFIVADLDDFRGVAGEQDAVALLDLHLAAGAVVEQLAGADGDDRAAGGLVLGGVGNVDAAGGLLLRFFALDDDFVAERLERDFGFDLASMAVAGMVPPGRTVMIAQLFAWK